MKESFRGYYRPPEAAVQKLWKEAHFSVDANVLLDLFRFSPETSQSLFSALKTIESRLWLSHQAGLEYHRNLPGVLVAGAEECQKIIKALESLERDLGLAEPHKKRTRPHVSSKTLRQFASLKKQLTKEAQKEADELLSQLQGHPMKEKVAALFAGRVGKPFSDDALAALFKEGDDRYKRSQPPGFRDAAKPSPKRYGDLILWRQLMDHSEAEKVSLVFITNDQKEDWFPEENGKKLGPHPELIEEFWSKTNQAFYCYSVARFLELAKEHLKVEVPKDAIDEAKTPASHGALSVHLGAPVKSAASVLGSSLGLSLANSLGSDAGLDERSEVLRLLSRYDEASPWALLQKQAAEFAAASKVERQLLDALGAEQVFSLRQQMEDLRLPILQSFQAQVEPLKGMQSALTRIEEQTKPLQKLGAYLAKSDATSLTASSASQVPASEGLPPERNAEAIRESPRPAKK